MHFSRRGRRAGKRFIMLSTVWIMVILSTTHWTSDVYLLIRRNMNSPKQVSQELRTAENVITALSMTNLTIADGVLVWRAWILCRVEFKRLLQTALVPWGITTVLVFVTITLRVIVDVTLEDGEKMGPALQGLNFAQVGTLMFSAMANMVATIVLTTHTWKNRWFMRGHLPHIRSSKSMQILNMIIVSGWVYSAYVCFSIFATCYKVSIGTIGDVADTVLVHISGIYPTSVITLADLQDTASPPSASWSIQIP
ncbi:hypothetical protein PHLGIDRAFT_315370 [Phlebiopsis gigantea 11061_1 CR5-6]|uniref:Uncharacterized protein n=1 Tax=Phlebiopsis gigantea (strain 11061_1 CR5-6) TaxID=745531 RepID=A0A0C3RQD4_PHLG1|nr:hypothetical protein PHLGIDRAFT_315370 [Phlebiopsis gigantea 11061_1 CR5-6]